LALSLDPRFGEMDDDFEDEYDEAIEDRAQELGYAPQKEVRRRSFSCGKKFVFCYGSNYLI
jgi:hypothetical protein